MPVIITNTLSVPADQTRDSEFPDIDYGPEAQVVTEVMEFVQLPDDHPLFDASFDEGFLVSYAADRQVRDAPLTTQNIRGFIQKGAKSIRDLPYSKGVNVV